MKDGDEIGAVATAMISRYRDTRASHADRIRANTVILSFTTLRGSDAPPRPRSHAPTKCPPYAFNRNLDRSGLVNLHPTAGWKNGKEKKREISLPPPPPSSSPRRIQSRTRISKSRISAGNRSNESQGKQMGRK